jgi:cytochrome P450 family 6
MLIAVSLLAVVLALAYIYFSYNFSHWENKGVHFVKPYPLVGSMLSVLTLREHMSEFFTRVYKQNTDRQFVGFFQVK